MDDVHPGSSALHKWRSNYWNYLNRHDRPTYDKGMVEAAIREGKLTKCPPGVAEGALEWTQAPANWQK